MKMVTNSGKLFKIKRKTFAYWYEIKGFEWKQNLLKYANIVQIVILLKFI